MGGELCLHGGYRLRERRAAAGRPYGGVAFMKQGGNVPVVPGGDHMGAPLRRVRFCIASR